VSADQIITVPADMVGRFRNGALGELGGAAREVAQASELRGREEHPEWFAEGLASFDTWRALLDQVGWMAAGPPVAEPLDVERHGELLLVALRGEVEIDDAAIDDIENDRITDPAHVAEIRERAERMREYVASVERELGRSS